MCKLYDKVANDGWMDALVGADGGPSPVPVIYSDQIRAHPDLPMMRCEKNGDTGGDNRKMHLRRTSLELFILIRKSILKFLKILKKWIYR
jgi:hypothetical protein